MRRLKHSPFATARARALLALWALLTVTIAGAVLVADLHSADRQLDQLANRFTQHVSDRTLISETAIEGFAAFVASLDTFDARRTREYARTLLKRYDFLYMFEVAMRVEASDREGFERHLGDSLPGFRIRSFAYDGERTWQPIGPAEYYYPLTFQEPDLPEPANVVGLDIHSSSFLKAAMQSTFARGGPVATTPFDLAEGGRGYVLHRSVQHIDGSPPHAFAAHQYALLALKSRDVFDGLLEAPPRVGVRLWYQDFADDDQRGEVLSVPAEVVSPIETWVLPRFRRSVELGVPSQPFRLALDWQLGWGDLSLLLIAAVLLGSVLSLWGIKSYAKQFVGDELASLQREGVLYELANFDWLTGLANRSRLMDFLESAVARARRQDAQFAVLFIDLDGFKAVNDKLGHSRGDRILVESARRLQQYLREDELMARYGGDEFIWVTDSSPEPPFVADMIRRLRQEFEPPFHIDGHAVNIGVSVGYSIYPRDGRNVAALIDVADAAMYRDKRRQHGGSVTPPR